MEPPLQVSWRNRNDCRAGEHLSISIGSEVQSVENYHAIVKCQRECTQLIEGAEMKLCHTFIYYLFYVSHQGNYVPRTNIQLGYDCWK